MPDIRTRTTQENPLVQVIDDEARRCAYTSPLFGRCRYWGAIHYQPGGPGWCAHHYRDRAGPAAEQTVEASLRRTPHYWELRTGQLVDQAGRPADDTTAIDWAARARALAERVGVDPDLPPQARCLAILRRLGGSARAVIGGGARAAASRQPGEDDE